MLRDDLDRKLLATACRAMLHNPYEPAVDRAVFVEAGKAVGASERTVIDTLEYLRRKGYLEGADTFGRALSSLCATDSAFEMHLNAVPDSTYVGDRKRVAEQVACNEVGVYNWEIASATEIDQTLVDHFLRALRTRGLVEFAESTSARIFVYPAPDLRRAIREGEL